MTRHACAWCRQLWRWLALILVAVLVIAVLSTLAGYAPDALR